MSKINNLCVKSILPPLAFGSFTGSVDYVGNDDAALSRNISENVDLPAIFRTLDQGVCPGLILSNANGAIVICSGHMAIIDNNIILISFNTINLLDIFVLVSLIKNDSGGTAIRIPGSEWYLTASTRSKE